MKVSKESKRKAVVLKLINDERKSKRLLSVTACSYYDCENTIYDICIQLDIGDCNQGIYDVCKYLDLASCTSVTYDVCYYDNASGCIKDNHDYCVIDIT